MEIVLIVTGVLALALLATLTLRRRASRGGKRRSRNARQWRGSAGAAQRTARSRPAVAAAAGAAGGSAYMSVGGGSGGVAVQDPPRTGEADLDAWDDDLEWTDDLDAAPEPPAANGSAPVSDVPAPVQDFSPTGSVWGAGGAPATYEEPADDLDDDLEPEPVAAAEPATAEPEAPAEQAFNWPAQAEPAWDDDLHEDNTVGGAVPDGQGEPIPSARGAAAFGAATATPAAPSRKRRGGVLRAPVVLVALYAGAGIALVVLAVSLLTSAMSPSESKKPERTSNVQTATPEPAQTPAQQGPTAAEKARRRRQGRGRPPGRLPPRRQRRGGRPAPRRRAGPRRPARRPSRGRPPRCGPPSRPAEQGRSRSRDPALVLVQPGPVGPVHPERRWRRLERRQLRRWRRRWQHRRRWRRWLRVLHRLAPPARASTRCPDVTSATASASPRRTRGRRG